MNTTATTSRHTGLRTTTAALGLAAAMAASWTLASVPAWAYTKPDQASTAVTSQPAWQNQGNRSENHLYGDRPDTVTTGQLVGTFSAGNLTHPTGNTAMHFRYGPADSY